MQKTEDIYSVKTHPNDDWDKCKQMLQTYMTDLVNAGMTRQQVFDRAYGVAYSIIAHHGYDLQVLVAVRS